MRDEKLNNSKIGLEKLSVAKKILIIQLPIGIVFRMKVSDFYYKYYF